jgi:hypothetical protein
MCVKLIQGRIPSKVGDMTEKESELTLKCVKLIQGRIPSKVGTLTSFTIL